MPEDLDDYHGEQVLVRPVPTGAVRREVELYRRKGKRHRGQISDSWWQKGGLLHDDRGPALLDAEGDRIPLGPFAPGSLLVRVHWSGMNTGDTIAFAYIVGPPPENQYLVRLPPGFEGEGPASVPGLHDWAEASGLEQKYFGFGFDPPPGRGRAIQTFGDWVTQDREQREWEARQPRGLRRLIPPPFRRHLSRSSDAAPH